MRFLVYLHNSRNLTPKDIPTIFSELANLEDLPDLEEKHYAIKNIRVSSKDVQIDLFLLEHVKPSIREDEMVERVVKQFERKIGPVRKIVNLTLGLTKGLDDRTIIERVVEEFNEQHYWEAQETAEAIWIKTKDPSEKNVVQGLILVGAALVHHQRYEDNVCLSMIHRALKKLDALDQISETRRPFLGIDMMHLRNELKAVVREGKVRDILLKQL